jgi:plastocyanin
MKVFVCAAIIAVVLCACAGTTQHERTVEVVAPTPQPAPPAPAEPAAAIPPPQSTAAIAPVAIPDAAVTPTPVPEAPTKPKPAKIVAVPAPVAAPPIKPPAPVAVEKKAIAAEGNALRGHIDLVVGPDQTVGAGEVADTVVYFMPAVPVHPKPAQFQIYTQNKLFDPAAIVIPVGSTVTFPNQDQIIHNVFSASVGEEFDLGLYGEGGTASHTFKKAGLAIVNCNVHQAMQTNVLVVDTPFFTRPSRSGDFVINGVPEGDGKLVIWHPRAVSVERAMAIPATERTWTISITKPRVAGHLNKEHKAYQRDVSQR